MLERRLVPLPLPLLAVMIAASLLALACAGARPTHDAPPADDPGDETAEATAETEAEAEATETTAGAGAESPASVRFVLEVPDEVDTDVWVQTGDAEAQPRWIMVFDANEERIWLYNPCGTPDCGSSGGVCGMSLSQVQELTADGGPRRIELTWDRLGSVYDEAAACETRQRVPDGRYVARFCHGASTRAGEFGGASVEDPQCTDVPFELPAATEVVHRVPAS